MGSYRIPTNSSPEKKISRTSTQKRLLTIVFLGLIVLLAIPIFKKSYILNSTPKRTPYYALFLSNDQVYFGHIIKENKQTIVLSNVYYLKANTSMSLQDGTENTPENPTAKLSLVKLGKELHSPKDLMVINRDHLLFYEEMAEGGIITKAIRDYKNQP